MDDQLTMHRVFIASPGGLDRERKAIGETVLKYNQTEAVHQGAYFHPLGWEMTPGGIGRPQGLINEDLKKCRYFILLLWNRWGTPRDKEGNYSSGVREEFELAQQYISDDEYPMKDMVVFFKGVDEQHIADPGPQLRQVLDFRQELDEGWAHLYKTFDTLEELKDLVRLHLGYWLRGGQDEGALLPSLPSPTVLAGVSIDTGEDRTRRQEDSAGSEVDIALDQADKLADEGKLAEAEAEYARLIVQTDSLDALNRYGLFLKHVGRLAQAQVMLERLGELAKLRHDEGSQAVAYGNLGSIYHIRGELDQAEAIYRKSLEIDERLARQEGMATAYGNLGVIYGTRGDLEKAEEIFLKSLEINERLGLQEGMANQYGNLAAIYRARSELDEAEKMLRKSLEIEERVGRQEGMASDYGNLGVIYQSRGHLEKAEQMHRKSLEISQRLGRQEGMASQYGNLGLIYKTRGDLDKAEEMHRKALVINERLAHQEGMAREYNNLGLIYQTRGHLDEAEQMFRKALEIFERIGMVPEAATTRTNLARLEAPGAEGASAGGRKRAAKGKRAKSKPKRKERGGEG